MLALHLERVRWSLSASREWSTSICHDRPAIEARAQQPQEGPRPR